MLADNPKSLWRNFVLASICGLAHGESRGAIARLLVVRFVLPIAWIGFFAAIAMAEQQSLLIGTYTRSDSEGIYLADFDSQTGELTNRRLAAKTSNPSFLAIHPDGGLVYAANEDSQFEGAATGAVTAFRIVPGPQLELLNQVASGGTAPCHVVVDAASQSVLVANYGGGNVASISIAQGGKLGAIRSLMQHTGSSINPQRQSAPHAHSINVDPQHRIAVAADLGIDQLIVYRLATDGLLTPHSTTDLPPGSGPRHFAFHPDGRHAFVINELTSTLTLLNYDAESGKLHPIVSRSTLPADVKPADYGNSTAEVVVAPDGRTVYGSNRGHDSIAVFQLNLTARARDQLQFVQAAAIGGKTPRNFVIDPSGKFLLAAGQSSNAITVFRIDAETGKLQLLSKNFAVPSPVCLRFLPGTNQ